MIPFLFDPYREQARQGIATRLPSEWKQCSPNLRFYVSTASAECSTIELSRNISLHLTKRKVDYMKYFQSSQDLFLIFQPQSTNGDGGI